MTKLTKRQEQVLDGIMHGASNEEISKALGISEPMVKKHLVKLYMAKGIHDRLGLVAGEYQRQIREANHVIKEIAKWGGYAERKLAKQYIEKWGNHDNTKNEMGRRNQH